MSAKERKSRREKTCRKKTEKGNVYLTPEEAGRAAASMSYKKGDYIISYRCAVCGRFHMGSLK